MEQLNKIDVDFIKEYPEKSKEVAFSQRSNLKPKKRLPKIVLM
jgi:hypothetical protein